VIPINVIVVSEDYFIEGLHRDLIPGLPLEAPDTSLRRVEKMPQSIYDELFPAPIEEFEEVLTTPKEAVRAREVCEEVLTSSEGVEEIRGEKG